METYYTVLMTLNVYCALAIMLSGIKKNKPYLLTLALLNILLPLYHYFTWQFHTALSLEDGILQSKYQTTFVLLFLPLLTFTFGRWCNYKHTNKLVLTYTLIIIPLLIIIFIGDYSLRYGDHTELIHYQSIFGDNLSLLIGDNNYFKWFGFLYILNFILILFFSYRLFINKNSLIALFIIIYILGQIFVTYSGYKIDRLEWKLFYFGGFPLTVFSVVITMLLSVNFKNIKDKFEKNISQKAAIETAMKSLAQNTSDSENNTFYNKTALNMQRLFKTKLVFIAHNRHGNINGTIETLAVVKNEHIISNFSYNLKDTPFNKVVGKKICIYDNDVDLLFPNDILLTEMRIKSYIGLPIFDSNEQRIGLIVLLHDIEYKIDRHLITFLKVFGDRIGSELSRDLLDKKLKYIAYNDYITNLPNKASLLKKISATFKTNITTEDNSLLMLIDVDNFKEVNTIYGYEIADDILKEIGHRLKVYIGESSFVARNNGDEFAILINQHTSDIESLIDIHWQAISAVIKAPIFIDNQAIKIECSAGVVIFPLQAHDRYSVIRHAESALQQAKYNGRNQYAVFNKNVQAAIERKKIILKYLYEAIHVNDQLSMVYQPQTDSKGKLLGAEALVRWTHPELGFISPGEFIPIVEQTELIHALGYWIIEDVLKQLQTWTISGETIADHISINIASKQLVHDDFVNKLINYCDNYDIKPSLIVLELTESGILTDTSFAIECLKKLRSYGFKIALDDFGTGYSSLSYLKDLPIDIIKIDKSFIDEIHILSTKQLIQSIFSIGAYLDLAIVAEGTENKDQIDELASLGCNIFQGYYFSKPLIPKKFINWHF